MGSNMTSAKYMVQIQYIIMLTGIKVIARALRRQFMTEAALTMKLVTDVTQTVSMSDDVRVRDREAHEQEETVKTVDVVSEACTDAHTSTESQTHMQLNADQVAELSEINFNVMEQVSHGCRCGRFGGFG